MSVPDRVMLTSHTGYRYAFYIDNRSRSSHAHIYGSLSCSVNICVSPQKHLFIIQSCRSHSKDTNMDNFTAANQMIYHRPVIRWSLLFLVFVGLRWHASPSFSKEDMDPTTYRKMSLERSKLYAGIERNELPIVGNDQSSNSPILRDELLNRFIVIPEHKLLFCYVEKVGCTMFNTLFDKLNGNKHGRPWFKNSPESLKLTKDDLENLLVNKEWTKAVFYRDPVSRFLSGFRSKCEDGHDGDGAVHCKQAFGKERSTFKNALTKITNPDTRSRVVANPHWKPMSDFCGGLDETLQYYDVVHELDKDTSSKKIEDLLLKVGVDQDEVEKLIHPDSSPKGKGSDYGKLGHTTNRKLGHTTNAEDAMCSYIDNAKELGIIENLYAKDYELFQFKPRPLHCKKGTYLNKY